MSLFNGDGTQTLVGTVSYTRIEVGAGGTATVTSGGGDDSMYIWHSKNVVFDAGNGVDSIRFEASRGPSSTPSTGATVDLTAHTGINPFGGTLSFTRVENVVGTTKSDTIKGDGQANRLDGGLGGSDTIRGMGGDDTIIFQSGVPAVHQTIFADGGANTDTIVYNFSGFPVAVNKLDLVTPGNNTGVFAGATIANFEIFNIGSYSTGSTNGSVDFNGTGVGEKVVAGFGADTLRGNGGGDDLDGYDGADLLQGGAGNDILRSALKGDFNNPTAGADTLDGGADTDRAQVWRFNITQAFVFTVNPNVTITLVDGTKLIGIESVEFYGGSGADQITGGALADTIGGDVGNDTLSGGAGLDTLIGGEQNDTYVLGSEAVNDIITEYANEGTDTVTSTISRSLASYANVENLTLLGTAVSGTGNASVNIITGNAANNTLTGAGAAADTLAGLGGNDTYVMDASTDIVQEALNAGTLDHVKWTGTANQTYALAANVELLTLLGTAATNGTGNAVVNTITGNIANNVLRSAGTGADTLIGLGANDTYIIKAGDIVNETAAGSSGTDTIRAGFTYTLTTNVENLVLTSNTTNTNGTGNAGNNTLDGASVAVGRVNTLFGLGGNDTYIIGAGDVVNETVAGSAGTDTVRAGFTYTLTANVENLFLTNNTIATNGTGNTGNNTLDGFTSAAAKGNVLTGLQGNDTYIIGAGDTVSETIVGAAGGTDTVISRAAYTLIGQVENLVMLGAGAGTGNALNNSLDGSQFVGANALKGLQGNDTYIISAGDTVAETIAGAPGGTDTVRSLVNHALGTNVENLVLISGGAQNGTGNTLANTITGNAFGNVLTGGGLNDTLIGGDGIDRFDFNTIADSATATRDRINDFQDFGDVDLIDLTDILPGAVATTKLSFGGNLAAFTANNQVIYQAQGANVLVSINLNGNNANAEMQIVLLNTTVAQIQAGDFLL